MEKKITGKESLELEKKISGKEVSGKEVSGKERRKQILELIRQSFAPLSGARLGQLTGVSRQVVVQDIALLRTEGHEIISTARGYILPAEEKCVSRKFKVYHTDERMEEELNTIVDLGGAVHPHKDSFSYHNHSLLMQNQSYHPAYHQGAIRTA